MSSEEPGPSSGLDDMMMVNEQVVACEVEIEGFDMQYDEEQPGFIEEHEPTADDNGYYQYEDETGNIYFLEDPDQMGGVMEYVDQKPSTSTSETPSGSNSDVQNSYMIRKNVPIRGHPYGQQISFQTTYTQSMNRRGRRVIKRTHIPMTSDEMDNLIEENHVMKRISQEVSALRKENAEMKKEYETVQKRLETVNLVVGEAKSKNREAIEEKKSLLRQLAQARNANTQVIKRMIPETQPRFF